MNISENPIRVKSFQFAVHIIKLCQKIIKEKREYILTKQLIRSATSVGANISEAICGISRRDFLAKMYISYKECSESCYWIDLLYACEYMSKENYVYIKSECMELMKMLSKITKTTRENLNIR
jgi:four helix bundle protein